GQFPVGPGDRRAVAVGLKHDRAGQSGEIEPRSPCAVNPEHIGPSLLPEFADSGSLAFGQLAKRPWRAVEAENAGPQIDAVADGLFPSGGDCGCPQMQSQCSADRRTGAVGIVASIDAQENASLEVAIP